MMAEENFWKWFVQHEAELLDFRADDATECERIFDQLATELRKVHPDLCFEFGPNGTAREFVISAGGIKRAFPAVVSLANAAPSLPRWRVIAFRPRRKPSVIEFSGKRVNPKDVQFSLLDNGKVAGIYLFIPGFRRGDDALMQIGYLLLDQVLGEYDVETRLGPIELLPPEVQTDTERYPLTELPELFDQLVARLAGCSDRPS